MVKQMFAMLAPTTSPKEMSTAFWAMDEKATKVSGREVPIATTVAPTTRGDIFIRPENFSMNFRRKLEEAIKNIREKENVTRRPSIVLYTVYTDSAPFLYMCLAFWVYLLHFHTFFTRG